MYKVFNLLSAYIRQFCLPNPYVMYFESSLYADIFNIIIGGTILHMFSFFLTSSIYEKRRNPSVVGCIVYCINYIFNTFLIQHLCSNIANIEIQNIILIAFCINLIIYIGFKGIKNKISWNNVLA